MPQSIKSVPHGRPGIGKLPTTRTIESNLHYYCQDCKHDWPGAFMLKDEVWKMLGLEGIICIRCCDKRHLAKFGRHIGPEDLKECRMNDPLIYAFQYHNRVQAQEAANKQG